MGSTQPVCQDSLTPQQQPPTPCRLWQQQVALGLVASVQGGWLFACHSVEQPRVTTNLSAISHQAWQLK